MTNNIKTTPYYKLNKVSDIRKKLKKDTYAWYFLHQAERESLIKRLTKAKVLHCKNILGKTKIVTDDNYYYLHQNQKEKVIHNFIMGIHPPNQTTKWKYIKC